MSIFNPCLVLYDLEQPKTTKEEREAHKQKRGTARITQFQITIPNDTRMKFLKLVSERRELK